jgi:hypothetical protein
MEVLGLGGGGSEAMESAAVEAASSRTRGSGWAPSCPGSPPGSSKPPRASRRTL